MPQGVHRRAGARRSRHVDVRGPGTAAVAVLLLAGCSATTATTAPTGDGTTATGVGGPTATADTPAPAPAPSATGTSATATTPTLGMSVARLLDGFAREVPSGDDADGTPVGLQSFGSDDALVVTAVAPAPDPAPESLTPGALRLDVTAEGYGGVVRVLGDGTGWDPVDASAAVGVGLWFHGDGTGAVWFVDVLDNRADGSVTDDAGRWTAYFVDDTPGWRPLSWAWDELERKDVGNGAPDDGLTVTEVNGWALGVLETGPDGVTAFVDDVALVSADPAAPPTPDPAPTVRPPSTVSPAL